MEPEVSLQRSKYPATCSILSQINPVHPHIISWRSILILSSHLRLDLPSGFFPWGLTTEVLHASLQSPVRATCHAHLTLPDLITRIILGKKHWSWFTSLCIQPKHCLCPAWRQALDLVENRRSSVFPAGVFGTNRLPTSVDHCNSPWWWTSTEYWWNENWQGKTEVIQ